MAGRYTKEQAKTVMGKIVEFQRNGLSAENIATQFNTTGVNTVSGKPWTSANVYAFVTQRGSKFARKVIVRNKSLLKTSYEFKEIPTSTLSISLISHILADQSLSSERAVKMLREYIG